MKIETLETFRAMQLAIIGADRVNGYKQVDLLALNEAQRISIGDMIEITEVRLDIDYVSVGINGVASYMPIKNLSDDVVEELNATMREIALNSSDRMVWVNTNNELSNDTWRETECAK